MADSWRLLKRSDGSPASSGILAVHAALLPSGKVLYFSGSEHKDEAKPPFDATRLWNPQAESDSTLGVERVESPSPDLFCSGHCFLPNGNLLVVGGTATYEAQAPAVHKEACHFTGIRSAHIFDWRSETWHKVGDMADGRWYPTVITLSDGRALAISGHNDGRSGGHENTSIEIFDPDPKTEAWGTAFETKPPLEDTGVFYLASGPIAGAIGGAAAGAAVGSIILPGIGTVIGTVVGAVVGAVAQPKIHRVDPMIYYPRLHLLPDGKIFVATALQVNGLRMTRTIGPPTTDATTGITTSVLIDLANPPFDQPRPYSHHGGGRYMENVYTRQAFASVLLPLRPPNYAAKILICGEIQPKLFELNNPHLGWQKAGPPRSYKMRAYANAVILPDATVLVVGGASSERVPDPGLFDAFRDPCTVKQVGGFDNDRVHFAERYRPSTNTWETLSAPDDQLDTSLLYCPIARVYHSVALLLPDGRVWIAGSNHDGARNNKDGRNRDDPNKGDARELQMEIYSPPYLFAKNAAGGDILDTSGKPVPAVRPPILWAHAGCAYGRQFEIQTATLLRDGDPGFDPTHAKIGTGIAANQISRVVLIRCSSTTHAFNADQRLVELVITKTTLTSLTVSGPPTPEIAPPGYYLLFVLSAGTPSIGRFFQVSAVYPVLETVQSSSDKPEEYYDFGRVELNKTREVTFHFKNVGVGQLKLWGASLLGEEGALHGDFRDVTDPGSPDFGIPAKPKNTDLELAPDTANPGSSALLKVRFTPTRYGQHAGVLQVITNAPDARLYTLHLKGEVQGLELEITPVPVRVPGLNFGDVAVGSSKTMSLTIKNVGSETAVLSGINFNTAIPAGQFLLPFFLPTISPGQYRTIDVAFSPTMVGEAYAAAAVLAESTPSPAAFKRSYAIELAGRGIGPVVDLSPKSLSFPSQLVRTTSPARKVTLKNTGSAPLLITRISTSLDFIQTNACSGSLALGQSCEIDVSFHPAGGGTRVDALIIESNAIGSPHVVALEGIGQVEPIVTLSASSLNFGNQPVGTGGAEQIITLTNDGAANLNVFSVAVTGANAGDFSVAADTCSGNFVRPEGKCEVRVRFNPTALGSRSAALEFTSDAGGTPHTVALSGIGIVPPAVSFNPTSLAFGNQPVGSTSPQKAITLTNNGTVTLNIGEIRVTGPNAGDFGVTAAACRGASLAPGASCIVSAAFAPTAIGKRTAGLTFSDDAPGSPQMVPLEGIGVAPALSWDPLSLVFQPQVVGTFGQRQQVMLSNSGNDTLLISSISISGDFRHRVLGATILPPSGGYCAIEVIFSPTAAGTRNGQLTIVSNAIGSPHTVPLSGEGTQPPATLSPTSLTFGNQPVGSASAAKMVTVTITDATAVDIISVNLTGANSGDFIKGVDNCAGSRMQPGDSCSVQVSFAPTAIGSRRAEIFFTTSRGPLIVPLTGSGS